MNDDWEQHEYKALNEFCSFYKCSYEVVAVSLFTKQVAVKLVGFLGYDSFMELTIEDAFGKVEAHQAGLLQDAERLYRAILQTHPQHPDANHNLGVLAVSVGKINGLPFLKLP